MHSRSGLRSAWLGHRLVLPLITNFTTALAVIGETGTDMSRFAMVGHFKRWLALYPGIKITGGKGSAAHFVALPPDRDDTPVREFPASQWEREQVFGAPVSLQAFGNFIV